MKQFYEAYKDFPKLSTLLREISWSHNLAIFSRCKTEEEREFYLRMSVKENYSVRELDRQISASLFERTMIGNTKLSTLPREIKADITNIFKDSYVFKFLNLPEQHKESEVVEYALSRSLSPTMVSEYQTQLPDKKLLQQKLHDIFENSK